MADTRSAWTLMKQGFLPADQRAEADVAARRVEPVIDRSAPSQDPADLERRRKEVYEKYRLLREQRQAQPASPVQDPETQGYQLRQRR